MAETALDGVKKDSVRELLKHCMHGQRPPAARMVAKKAVTEAPQEEVHPQTAGPAEPRPRSGGSMSTKSKRGYVFDCAPEASQVLIDEKARSPTQAERHTSQDGRGTPEEFADFFESLLCGNTGDAFGPGEGVQRTPREEAPQPPPQRPLPPPGPRGWQPLPRQ